MFCYVTSLLADLKGSSRRRFVPQRKGSAGSSNFRRSDNCNGTGAGSSSSKAAPRYTSEKKVCYVLKFLLVTDVNVLL